jgi:hypothetical protein
MTRKIIAGVVAAVLLVTIAVLAAEKVKEKVLAEKPKAGERGEKMGQPERLLDELAEAYKAKDMQKMGKIINKMQERREKMQEFVKANRWHKWQHRQMMGQMGPGWGRGQQMAGPGWNRGCGMQGRGSNQGCGMQGQGWNQGCPMAGAIPQCGQFQAMRGRGFGGCNNMMGNCGTFAGPQNAAKGWGCGPGFYNGMGNCGPMAGGFEQMPCQQGGVGPLAQPNGQRMPMRGWRQGFQREWPGPGAENMGQQEWNMPRHERQNVPPPEWGW